MLMPHASRVCGKKETGGSQPGHKVELGAVSTFFFGPVGTVEYLLAGVPTTIAANLNNRPRVQISDARRSSMAFCNRTRFVFAGKEEGA